MKDGKISLKDQRKNWKAEAVSIESIISGFYAVEKASSDYFHDAVVVVLGNNVTTKEQFAKLIDKANATVLQTEMDERLAACDTLEGIKAIKSQFIHGKTTKQHVKGTFKTSILPNSWRTAVSVIGSALELGVPLYAMINGEYVTTPKSVLDKLIKAKKEGSKPATNETESLAVADDGTLPTSDNMEDGVGTGKEELPPLSRLDLLIAQVRHTLAELETEKEREIAVKMIDTLWDLSPMKVGKAA